MRQNVGPTMLKKKHSVPTLPVSYVTGPQPHSSGFTSGHISWPQPRLLSPSHSNPSSDQCSNPATAWRLYLVIPRGKEVAHSIPGDPGLIHMAAGTGHCTRVMAAPKGLRTNMEDRQGLRLRRPRVGKLDVCVQGSTAKPSSTRLRRSHTPLPWPWVRCLS